MGGNSIQAHILQQLPIVALSAIGDSHVLSTSFLEQFAAVVSVSRGVTGETGNRTFDFEFRHSIDNSTWSAWFPVTLGYLGSIAYVANNRAYFQWRMTRTGTDNTGTLYWNSLVLGYSYDRQANCGFGSFTDVGMISEVGQFLKAVIQSRVPDYGGRDRFLVLEYEELQASHANNNVVLIAGIQCGGENAMYTESGDWPISCDLYIKMQNGQQGNIQAGYSNDYKEMQGILMQMFREDQAWKLRYSFTFKGVSFVSVPLGELGAAMFAITHQMPIYNKETNATYAHFQLKFTIFAQKIILG